MAAAASNISPEDPSLPPLPELLQHSRMVRPGTSMGNFDVYELTWQGKKFLLKSHNRRWFLVRWLYSGPCLSNEMKMLQHLEQAGFTVAPKAVALLGNRAIVTEFLESSAPLRSAKNTPANLRPSAEALLHLWEELQQLHQQGFVHGDIRRANIMRNAQGTLRLIDWTTGIYIPPNAPWWRRCLHPLASVMRNADNYALAKIIKEFHPELLENGLIPSVTPGMLLQLGRFFRQTIYRKFIKPINSFFTGRNRKTTTNH